MESLVWLMFGSSYVPKSSTAWCFYARRIVLRVLAASFVMEIIMTHSSMLHKGHHSSVTCCFTLSDN